jgi:hypothetical protein
MLKPFPILGKKINIYSDNLFTGRYTDQLIRIIKP